MKSEYLDLFDGYYAGSLNEQEQRDLENRLETDLNIQTAYKEYRDLRSGIDYSIMKSLKEELKELDTTLPELTGSDTDPVEMKPVVNPNRFLLMKVAAIVLLVVVSTVVLFQWEQPSEPQHLYVEHFQPFENQFVSAKRGDNVSADPLVKAFQAYDNQDWEGAIEGFEKILANKEDLMVLFYLGNARLARNDSKEAITIFERFLKISKDSLTDAKWYLALAFLKENRVEEARATLQELIEDQQYGADAKTILSKLD